MISRNDYDSFGEIVASSGISQNAVTYTGQRLDLESGLMALGNGERYYNPSYGRFIQQDSYAGMPDMPQSLNRFSYGHNNPNKYVDPSGNEGVIADQMRSKVQNGIANTGNETADWWINFGANFVTGFAYDAANTSTGGLLGTADVMAQDVMNGKMPDPVSAWQRGGYSATQSQIYTNFAYYSAGAVKGVGNLAYGIATGVPTLAYGLATDTRGTLNNVWLGLADKTASVIDTALNPRKALDDLAQHSQEDIAFGLGEVVGETATSAGIAKVGVAFLGKAKKSIGKYRKKRSNRLKNNNQKPRQVDESHPEFLDTEFHPRTYDVKPNAVARDIKKYPQVFDDVDSRTYTRNDTRITMEEFKGMISNVGNIQRSGYSNKFMFVIDEGGNLIFGNRARKRMPHPTLIGGKNPKVLGAGMVEIVRGKIKRVVVNDSGHFKPSTDSVPQVLKAFDKIPKQVFDKDFDGYKLYDER